jgi:hypothetical protein
VLMTPVRVTSRVTSPNIASSPCSSRDSQRTALHHNSAHARRASRADSLGCRDFGPLGAGRDAAKFSVEVLRFKVSSTWIFRNFQEMRFHHA